MFSDHKLIICELSTKPTTQKAPTMDGPEPMFTDWRPLWRGDAAANQAMGEALEQMPEGLDLAQLNKYILDQASTVLGTRRYHTHYRNPWMSDRTARRLLHLYMEAKELYNSQPSEDTRMVLKEVHAAFHAARDRAKDAAHMSLLHKVHDRQITVFNALSRLTRRPAVHRRNPYLDGEETVGFWRTIFDGGGEGHNEGDGASTTTITDRRYSDHISFVIQPDTVIQVLLAMAPSAPGPDKLPLRVLTMFAHTLAPRLASALTKALSHMPDAMRAGETLLFPKTNPPSDNPAEYRPITLLPILIRVLHKIIDIEIRKHIFGDPGADPVQRHLHSLIFVGQAGFQKDRCANEAAMTLHILLAAQRAGGGHNSLFGAFLDIHKAFDSLDHGHLLDMLEHNLHLSRDWLEIIRRLLIGNTTTLMGQHIAIHRGSAQGSPLSPSLCLVYLDDLAKDLLAFFHEHNIPFPLQNTVPGLAQHWLLLLLLLFADDVLVLGLTLTHLQLILDRIGEWATRRGLRLSSKSVAAVLVGTTGIPLPMPSLRIQNVSLQWVEGGTCAGYLGVPYKAYKPHWRSDGPFPIDLKELKTQVGSIHALFRSPSKRRLVYIPTLILLTEQLIRAKALYPTDVVDIDYDALDTLVYDLIRRVIQLPKCTPKAMLFWELGMLPSQLSAYRRALRAMWRYVHFSPFYYHVISPILRHRQHRGILHLFTRGPLARMSKILDHQTGGGQKLWNILTPNADDSTQVLLAIARTARGDWYSKVEKAIAASYERWVQGKLREYPEHYRACLTRTLRPVHGKGRPAYLSLAGDRARVALRFKTPFLRYFHDRSKPVPDCAWCGAQAAEHPLHLAACPAQPASVREPLAAARIMVTNEAGQRGVDRAIQQMCWSNQSQESTCALLGAIAHLINEYRKAIIVTEGEEHPITAVRTIDLGGRAEEHEVGAATE
jgi:hypothetical protein